MFLTHEDTNNLHGMCRFTQHSRPWSGDSGWKTYWSCQKHGSLSLQGFLSTGRNLLGVSFIASLRLNLGSAPATQSSTENYGITSHAKHTTELQRSLFVTGLHRLLVIKRRTVSCPKTRRIFKVKWKLLRQYQYEVPLSTVNVLPWSSFVSDPAILIH